MTRLTPMRAATIPPPSPAGTGEPTSTTHTATTAAWYAYDNEAALSFYGFRYYDPKAGRWLSRDPIEERAGPNLYWFVGNDPINYWDAVGLVEGKFTYDGVQYTGVGPGRYAISPATLTENSCVCKKGFFSCKWNLSCTLSVRTATYVNPRDHRVWGGKFDSLIGGVLAHEQLHITHYRSWYDSQKAWIVGFEGPYNKESECLWAKNKVETTTESSWQTMYQHEINHDGPNWP